MALSPTGVQLLAITAYIHTCERKSLKKLIPGAWGCLTPSPCITGVLTLSLARNDHFFLILDTSHALHAFACSPCFSSVFLVFRLNRLGGDSFALSLLLFGVFSVFSSRASFLGFIRRSSVTLKRRAGRTGTHRGWS